MHKQRASCTGMKDIRDAVLRYIPRVELMGGRGYTDLTKDENEVKECPSHQTAADEEIAKRQRLGDRDYNFLSLVERRVGVHRNIAQEILRKGSNRVRGRGRGRGRGGRSSRGSTRMSKATVPENESEDSSSSSVSESGGSEVSSDDDSNSDDDSDDEDEDDDDGPPEEAPIERDNPPSTTEGEIESRSKRDEPLGNQNAQSEQDQPTCFDNGNEVQDKMQTHDSTAALTRKTKKEM